MSPGLKDKVYDVNERNLTLTYAGLLSQQRIVALQLLGKQRLREVLVHLRALGNNLCVCVCACVSACVFVSV